MAVTHMWVHNKMVVADASQDQSGLGFHKNVPGGEIFERCLFLSYNDGFRGDLGEVHMLQNEVNGNAFEDALLRSVEPTVGNIIDYRQKNKKVCEIPYNKIHKHDVSISWTSENSHLLVLKGDPEKILDRCTTIVIHNSDDKLREYPMTVERKEDFDQAYMEMNGLGDHVLGFCDFVLDTKKYPEGYQFDPNEILKVLDCEGLRFVGLLSMVEEVKVIEDGNSRFIRNINIVKDEGQESEEKKNEISSFGEEKEDKANEEVPFSGEETRTKSKEEPSFGDFLSAMGTLMTAVAPQEDAQKIQEGVNQFAQLADLLMVSNSNTPKESETEESGTEHKEAPSSVQL